MATTDNPSVLTSKPCTSQRTSNRTSLISWQPTSLQTRQSPLNKQPIVNSLFPHNGLGEEDDKDSAGQFLGEFWEVMFRFAPQLDYQGQPMQRYIALHTALRELPETIMNGRRVWQDRPRFGVDLHEIWRRTFHSS